ncbi:metallophosphoesterase [Rhizobium sp. YJ-22]|uniref:metallophosphoesterase n=1 Tax=Rhizobium sp. YJ-22 TaxID=3037556 RepID=UPI002412ADFD|nr:metallophosphoesterase [Rhizobium sp. YJ-22]MDG3574761.1 metallophosphoesterase [Rhizobium sp. YJ-22]
MSARAHSIDIIPDIHADMERLTRTLVHLGYRKTEQAWAHPEGRIAAFLGDFIDMGTQNAAVISLVRAMQQRGHAVAILGNHELNALLYHEPGVNSDGTNDGYMRAHNAKNTRQHQTFLREFPLDHPRTRDVLDWFLTLPVFLDLPGLRLIHACWDSMHIETIRERSKDGRLQRVDLQELAFEDGTTSFAKAVLTVLKGPEAELPSPHHFLDIKGHERSAVRLNWWQPGARTWRTAALSVPDPSGLPDTPVADVVRLNFYGADQKPVFFGHYKRCGQPMLDAPNALCLDYPLQPCAYRWDGERELRSEGLVSIPSKHTQGDGQHSIRPEMVE